MLKKVENYRPIQLCNEDYKIFAKVLNKRLKLIIEKLINEHQTCGIRGGTTQTNLHVARLVLECASDNSDQVAHVQIELANAFDRVSNSFLFTLLQRINVGMTRLEEIKFCWANSSTSFIVHNIFKDENQRKSSVRQGCPPSSLFFALQLEPLCLSILESEKVHGYSLGNAEVKVLLQADDVAFLVPIKAVSTKE